MDVICSVSGIVNPFCPGQGIADIANAGFENLFLNLDICCPPFELEHYGEKCWDEAGGCREDYDFLPVSEHPAEINRFFEKILSVCKEKHLSFQAVYAPYMPRDTEREDSEELLFRLHEESIRFCGQIGCRYIIIRPSYAGSLDETKDESCWEVNRRHYLRLLPAAHENNVMILLENQCRSMNGHMVRSTCSDSQEAAGWIDTLNREAGAESFGFCMDAGVCSLCGQDMYEFAVTLGGRIKAVVLRDCDGQHEGYMLPFSCICYGQSQTDWLRLIRGLRETGFDGHMILSIRDTAAVFSPLLRPQLMALAKAVAEYFKWQIQIENLLKKYKSIVLFGAGNMCRNYMKCYGEKYPPLFTCDNNSKAWGTMFCGLEVKPPEALKKLPEDCGVFICNIYYREIEQQLRCMGIENIEFFNDEYMPSFYFDRLKEV